MDTFNYIITFYDYFHMTINSNDCGVSAERIYPHFGYVLPHSAHTYLNLFLIFSEAINWVMPIVII